MKVELSIDDLKTLITALRSTQYGYFNYGTETDFLVHRLAGCFKSVDEEVLQRTEIEAEKVRSRSAEENRVLNQFESLIKIKP